MSQERDVKNSNVWWPNINFRVTCPFKDSIMHLSRVVMLFLTSTGTPITTITTATPTHTWCEQMKMRTRWTEGQSGFLMAAHSEVMRATASAGRINIISSILWLPVAYLWPGFCALGANNASKKKKKTAEWKPSPSLHHSHSRATSNARLQALLLIIAHLLFPTLNQSSGRKRKWRYREGKIGFHNESTTAE